MTVALNCIFDVDALAGTARNTNIMDSQSAMKNKTLDNPDMSAKIYDYPN